MSRVVHLLEKRVCTCGHIFVASSPPRVTEGCHYGPGLNAYAVVTKCADAMPLNRITKRFGRAGLHVARSTLTDLYHRTASLLVPIYRRLLAWVAASEYVNADETSQPVMDDHQCHRGYLWTFIAGTIITYVKARDSCPDLADHCLGIIHDLYQVEYDAAQRNVLETEAHRWMRQHRSKPLLDDWKAWLKEQKEQHTPKSPMGQAIRYTINQWAFLTRFLDDPKLRLDNNISEAAHRIIALGRDNFRWVGHDESGENLAVLQTIVATCIANGVNPQDYITDVLIRVQHHPASPIDDLLPMNWQPPES